MLSKRQEVVEDFLQYLMVERRYSPQTIRAYKVDLEKFFNSLHQNLSITKISSNDIQLFLQGLSKNKISERSLARKLASIKSLFNYLVRQEKISVNIAKLIKSPKIPEASPAKFACLANNGTGSRPPTSANNGITSLRILLRVNLGSKFIGSFTGSNFSEKQSSLVSLRRNPKIGLL